MNDCSSGSGGPILVVSVLIARPRPRRHGLLLSFHRGGEAIALRPRRHQRPEPVARLVAGRHSDKQVDHVHLLGASDQRLGRVTLPFAVQEKRPVNTNPPFLYTVHSTNLT